MVRAGEGNGTGWRGSWYGLERVMVWAEEGHGTGWRGSWGNTDDWAGKTEITIGTRNNGRQRK